MDSHTTHTSKQTKHDDIVLYWGGFAFLVACMTFVIAYVGKIMKFVIIRHRWTGRFEAHLWDKATWNTIQNKKGRQSNFFLKIVY